MDDIPFSETINATNYNMNENKQEAGMGELVARDAVKLLRAMYINDSMPERVSTLSSDIEALASAEFDGDIDEAISELRTRIGGWKNLLSYSNCLVIGARKRNRI